MEYPVSAQIYPFSSLFFFSGFFLYQNPDKVHTLQLIDMLPQAL